MRKLKNKIIAVLFALLFVCLCASPAFATDALEFDLDAAKNAKAVYLYSFDADRVLFCTGSDETLSPGPTAKIMTGLIACERFQNELDRSILITPQMLDGAEGNSMGLNIGMTLSVKDLLYGTICGGNNDAAQALALICSSSIDEFVNEMNQYAKALYMKNTVYSNPTGLDDDMAMTSIYDVAMLARKAAENELYLQISAAQSYNVLCQDGKKITVYNRNALVSQFSAQGYINKNAQGIISGRDDGGFSTVSIAEKNGMRFLCVVMNAASDEDEIYSYYITNSLFDKAFKSYSKVKIFDGNTALKKINVYFTLTDEPYVYAVVPEDVYAILPSDFDKQGEFKYKVYLHETNLDAPITKGTAVGGVDFYYNGLLIAKSKLVTNEDVQANMISLFIDRAKSFLIGRFFITFVIISAVSITFFLILDNYNRRHRITKRRYR